MMKTLKVEASGSTSIILSNIKAEWSYPENGTIEIDNNEFKFNEWVIPCDSITNAVLNSENLDRKKYQILVLENSISMY